MFCRVPFFENPTPEGGLGLQDPGLLPGLRLWERTLLRVPGGHGKATGGGEESWRVVACIWRGSRFTKVGTVGTPFYVPPFEG